ncbi:YhdP family protein [Castellaniella sp.]|uniref:YhdP family protein n=1 Tax=Castellaniella sp. TaxID=1955812 RepID=UPI003C71A404
MRQFISKLSSVWSRRVLAVLLSLYFGLGVTLLAGRYLILPHLDDWRPQIAAHLSQRVGAQVSLGSIRVSWRGWNPQFDLSQVRVTDDQGHALLTAPSVRAGLNWAALLPGRQGVLRLRVQGMDLGLTRLPDGQFSLLGQVVELDQQADSVTMPAWLQWVLDQPLISFQDATLRWHDQRRGAPELTLRNVHAVLRRQGTDEWGLSLSAQAPMVGDARLDASLVAGVGPQEGRQKKLDWRGWLRLGGAGARDWRPWIELPRALEQGRLDAQFWAQPGRRAPELTALLGLQSVRWAASDSDGVQVPEAELWMQGGLDQWQALARGDAAPDGLAFDLRTRDVRLEQPQWFDAPLAFGTVAARGRVAHAAQWSLQLQRLVWRNADIDLQGSGRWDGGGPAGTADFQGTIVRARLDAIHRYLPREVDADAREWLAKGLQAGTLFDGHWLLRGDLAEFPFGDQPQAGDFQVRGDFRDARIEFVPDAAKEQSWPLLQDVVGTADLHRMDLRLTASAARMEPVQGQEIRLSGVQARIPDLEHDATLRVSGHSAADGDAYMALIRQSPLAHLLDGVFDEASAGGDWQVPLSLTIPLLNTDDSQVQGRVDLQHGRLQFLPQAPAFEAMDGSVFFSEQGVRLAQPLSARILGGPVQVRGELGDAQAAGLSFQGRLTAKALAAFVGVPGMNRLSGALNYQAQLARRGRAYVFTLDSDTRGLALDFPAPLAKPAEQARSLKVRWTDADAQADVLDARLGDMVTVGLRHVRRTRQGPYFEQALIGLGQAADDGGPGLRLALRYPLIDLDRWNRIVDEFSIPRRGHAPASRTAASRPLWPDLSLLSVQADQLRLQATRLDQAALRVTRTPDERWSLNLRSKQTTGTLKWRELDGRVQGPMSGRFARLSLGDDSRDTQSLLPDAQSDDDARFDDDLEIPGLILQADDLRLYGRSMGALSLEGVRDSARHVWQLNHLRMGDDDARLQGSGTWRLRGPDRGLSLKATVTAKNLGAWLSRAGWPGVLSGGQGTLAGDFTWRNLPWRHDKADLQGSLQIDLDKGRFLKIASQTAKLLEVLSLQSITRLNRLEQGLVGLPKDGFPFDQLRGSLTLNQGVVQAHDYKVIGSVGTILLEGSTNILNETLDLQAVMVPNLDVSGAALAAGIAINPLVGLGAFVTQWLLKTPLAKAMTVRYQVTGTWDDPKVKEVPVSGTAQAGHEAGPEAGR